MDGGLSRERKYSLLRTAIGAMVGGGVGAAVALQLPLLALLAIVMGLVLSVVLRSSFRDITLVDERVIRIHEKAAAQTLRLFMLSVGSVYIALISLRAVGMNVQPLWDGLLPLVYVVLILMLLHYAAYLYYKRRM